MWAIGCILVAAAPLVPSPSDAAPCGGQVAQLTDQQTPPPPPPRTAPPPVPSQRDRPGTTAADEAAAEPPTQANDESAADADAGGDWRPEPSEQ
ncbi:MAG: hypothetical protein ACP5KN_04165, partial [Armatimonadota bacterium]